MDWTLPYGPSGRLSSLARVRLRDHNSGAFVPSWATPVSDQVVRQGETCHLVSMVIYNHKFVFHTEFQVSDVPG